MVAWSPGAILRSQLFWPLAVALGLVFGFMGGWNYNMGKFMSDLGYDMERTSYLLGAGAIVGIPGTFLLGWLADRYDGRGLLWIALGMQVAAFAVMRTKPGFPLLMATSAVIGCTAGGLLPVYAALIGRSLGPAAFGIAMGIGGIVQLPFMAAAPPLLGRMRDTSGNFDSALLLLIAVYFVAGALLGLLPRAGVPSTRPRLAGPD
jgi:cyanate permease